MTDQSRARAILAKALTQAAGERDAFLEEACGDDPELRREVEELLAAGGRDDPQPGDVPPVGGPVRPDADDESTGAAGTAIGPYLLIEKIGEGGFGSVWLAEQQEPITRQVALKVIKLGMDTQEVIGRFEVERQTLALLDHPGIAKVYDAGSTESGRPYFVMELVRGEQILEYCDRAQLHTRARLELFTKVCQAIQHAHQKGIIHRDIKPSNVLVTLQEGLPVPKVIDFGIAKATGAATTQLQHFTVKNEMIGTPLYMSPEQAAMTEVDIDTRSDIYSLGVLLYEILTGVMPFDAEKLIRKGFVEMMWALREGEPPLPSARVSGLGDTAARAAEARRSDVKQLASALRGDLDWIVMQCLEKDRERRYETAGALAEDIRRHLNHEPVAAGPPSTAYRLRKFVRRNRTAVAAGLLVAAALVLGAVVATWGLIQSRREQARTAAALAELEQVTAFQAGQLSGIDTRLMGTRLREDIIARRQGALEAAGLREPSIAAGLIELESAVTGVNFTDVALKTLEANIFDRALATLEQDFAYNPLIKARLLQVVADTLRKLGLLDRALVPQQEALEIRRLVLGPEHPDTLTSISHMGLLFDALGKPFEAEGFIREALEKQRRVLGEGHPDTLLSLNKLGLLLKHQGKFAEAETYLLSTADGFRRTLGEEHPKTLTAINNVGLLFDSLGRLDDAEGYYREALEGRRQVLGEDHPDTLNSLTNVGAVLLDRGKPDLAEPYWREALEGRRRVLGDHHLSTLNSILNMGGLMREIGRLDEAETLWREALEGCRRVLGEDHPRSINALNNMGFLLHDQGRLGEAEPFYREVLERRRRILGEEQPQTIASMNNLGGLLRDQGRLVEAESLYREAVAKGLRVLGEDHPNVLHFINNLGGLLLLRSSFEESVQLLEPFEDAMRQAFMERAASRLASFLDTLGRAHAGLGSRENLAVAEQKLKEAHALLSETMGSDHPSTVEAGQALAAVRDARHKE